MQQVKDTISAVKETLGMAQRADKTDVELTAETATATPIDTPACANPANATDLFDKAKEEVHAAAEEAHIAQVWGGKRLVWRQQVACSTIITHHIPGKSV